MSTLEPAEWVTIAVLGVSRGNRGELFAIPLGRRAERLVSLARVWLFGAGRPVEGVPYEVESVWVHDGRPVMKLRGVDSIGAAAALAGAEVRLPIGDREPLEPGEYYQADLVGCEVMEQSSGVTLGRVTGWQEFGGPALLEVKAPDGVEILIPFARAICVRIDPEARRITVDLPEGLKELNRK